MAWVSKFYQSRPASKVEAKNRLKLVLMHDRASISPEVLDRMKLDLLNVVKKYVEIDPNDLEFALSESQRTVTLVANIAIRNNRRTPVI